MNRAVLLQRCHTKDTALGPVSMELRHEASAALRPAYLRGYPIGHHDRGCDLHRDLSALSSRGRIRRTLDFLMALQLGGHAAVSHRDFSDHSAHSRQSNEFRIAGALTLQRATLKVHSLPCGTGPNSLRQTKFRKRPVPRLKPRYLRSQSPSAVGERDS